MSLTLIAVPIGNPDDITLRALESLKTADLYIGEERKPMFRLIKSLGLPTPQNFELLNEHSTPEEVAHLAVLCENQNVVLVSDCGTPGFSDPGSELVALCQKRGIPVTANPGASSLTCFISLCGLRLRKFHFEGFLPRETGERTQRLGELGRLKIPVLVMDTPYRLTKTLQECSQTLPDKKYILGLDLTKPEEKIAKAPIKELLKEFQGQKREFLLFIH